MSGRGAGGTSPRKGRHVDAAASSQRGGRNAAASPTRKASSASARWLARLRLLTGLIVVLSASILVAWGLRRYLQSSPRFAIRTVEVDGNARRSARQLATLAGATPGQNVFAVDLRIAEQSVEADPWVERASVTRELPSTIRIEVTEREARALLVLDGRLFLVDGKGTAFKAVKEDDPTDLPVITGVESEQIARDRDGTTQRLRRMVDLLADLERLGIDRRFPVQEVRLGADDSVTVIIGSEAIALQFGRPPYRAKVEQADRILVELGRRKATADVVFLDDEAHPERVVVRMR